MPFKFFVIPVQASQAAEDEMNTFIRGHTVLHVDQLTQLQSSQQFIRSPVVLPKCIS
jgi:hypothetical protein